MRKKIIQSTATIIATLIIIIFVLSLIYKQQIQTLLSSETQAYSSIFLFLISFLLDFIPQYFSPHILIINAAIIKLSLFYVTTIAIIGSILGGIFGFEIGKKYNYGELEKTKIKKYIEKYGKYFMALAAISPLPYFPLIFGTLNIKRTEFLIFGITPRIIGLIATGLFLSVI